MVTPFNRLKSRNISRKYMLLTKKHHETKIVKDCSLSDIVGTSVENIYIEGNEFLRRARENGKSTNKSLPQYGEIEGQHC